jgi:hypothetical protein
MKIMVRDPVTGKPGYYGVDPKIWQMQAGKLHRGGKMADQAIKKITDHEVARRMPIRFSGIAGELKALRNELAFFKAREADPSGRLSTIDVQMGEVMSGMEHSTSLVASTDAIVTVVRRARDAMAEALEEQRRLPVTEASPDAPPALGTTWAPSPESFPAFTAEE